MAITARKTVDGKQTRYLVRIESRDPLTGKRKRITVGTFSKKKDAERAEREALTQRERGTLLEPTKTTVTEMMTSWLATKRSEITSQTYVDYEITIRRHISPALGAIPVQRLTPARVQAQYADWEAAGKSAYVIRICHLLLSQALKQAVLFGIVSANVCDNVSPPRRKMKRPRVWNAEEAAAFLAVAETDTFHPLWHLLLLEGMRRGEALGLRWRDINWGRGTAHIIQTVSPDKSNRGKPTIWERTKTTTGARTVRLTTLTLTALKEHRTVQLEHRLATSAWEDNDLIICNATGQPANPDYVGKRFTVLTQRAGLPPLRVHDLRHTSATLLLLAGTPAKIVSERLGHATVAITLDLYSHVLPDMQDRAAEDMDRLLGSTSADTA